MCARATVPRPPTVATAARTVSLHYSAYQHIREQKRKGSRKALRTGLLATSKRDSPALKRAWNENEKRRAAARPWGTPRVPTDGACQECGPRPDSIPSLTPISAFVVFAFLALILNCYFIFSFKI
ncbi:hypothetical protein HPB48_025447 [Haemaphysalis longicornis]|uniref:Uncharacterized protein n=1 Tax=Haemaphysalis longicornis TaxID=44386 RepID=A0A9J6H9J6_HAELO|nr:hypothetical protein HPB48_025447 [Haemaphysalis longicornis]